MEGGFFTAGLIFSFILGLCVGSFNNVLIYRLPRKLSIVKPSSSCPACGTPIKWYDNIPILSYIALQGKCRHCGAKISLIYPAVEILTGLMSVGVFLKFGFSFQTVKFMFFTWAMVPIFFIDLFHMIIPDRISLPLIGAGIVFSAFEGPGVLFHSIVSALIAGGGLFLLATFFSLLLKKEAMGMGDVKFITGVGAFLGIKGAIFTLFAGSLIGSILGIPLLVLRGSKNREIPYGPFLVTGAVIYVFTADLIVKFTESIMYGF